MCFLLFPLSSIETKFYTEEQNDSEQHKLNGYFEMSQKKRFLMGWYEFQSFSPSHFLQCQKLQNSN